MVNLFYSFWWLIIPVAGIAFAAWNNFLKYRQQKAVLDLIRTYAERGEHPPESLVARLGTLNSDDDPASSSASSWGRSPAHYWSLVGLFGVMAAGFGIGAVLVDGAGGPFVIVAMVMAAVGVWSLINAIMLGRADR